MAPVFGVSTSLSEAGNGDRSDNSTCSVVAETEDYGIHPAVFDACFQVFGATLFIAWSTLATLYADRG